MASLSFRKNRSFARHCLAYARQCLMKTYAKSNKNSKKIYKKAGRENETGFPTCFVFSPIPPISQISLIYHGSWHRR